MMCCQLRWNFIYIYIYAKTSKGCIRKKSAMNKMVHKNILYHAHKDVRYVSHSHNYDDHCARECVHLSASIANTIINTNNAF